jgi:hypothetical protein
MNSEEQVLENTGLKDLDLLMVNEFVEKRLGEKMEDADPPLEKSWTAIRKQDSLR